MFLSKPEILALLLSIKVALLCVTIILIPGVVCGWLLARKQFPGKTFFDVFVHIPLVLPPVVTGYLLLVVFGRNGVVGSWLEEFFGFHLSFTWKGAALASGVIAFPLLVRSVRLSVELVDRKLEEAAQSLGSPPLRTFFSITLPLSLPGILTGMVLAFARSLGEFGATIIFAGNIQGETQTLPLAIFSQLQIPGAENSALRLVLISVIFSAGAMFLSEVFSRKLHKKVTGEGG